MSSPISTDLALSYNSENQVITGGEGFSVSFPISSVMELSCKSDNHITTGGEGFCELAYFYRSGPIL